MINLKQTKEKKWGRNSESVEYSNSEYINVKNLKI